MPSISINQQLRQSEGSPLIRLKGDSFVRNEESQIVSLDSLNTLLVPRVLTQDGAVDAVFALPAKKDLNGNPIKIPKHLQGHKVVRFVDDATDTMQLSGAQGEAEYEVGTGDLTASIWFRRESGIVGEEYLFSYGAQTGGDTARYELLLTTEGRVQVTIHDGTNLGFKISDNIFGLDDGKWHSGVMMIDRTLDTMNCWVDGRLFSPASAVISAVTGSLDNANEGIHFGSRNAAPTGRFTGELADFHLIKAVDFNALQVLTQGIREKVSEGTYSLGAQTLSRLNNSFQSPNQKGAYTTTVIDVEEGIYEFQSFTRNNTNRGIYELIIDGKLITTYDTNKTAGYSILNSVTGIELSAGKHILKWANARKLTGSTSVVDITGWISLIKREGHEQGGATKFLLLGDEIRQREDSNFAFVVDTSSPYGSSYIDTGAATGEFWEGDLFIKGGLYKIEVIADGSTDRCAYNLTFGDVKVLNEDITWDGGALVNQVLGQFVRLNQGKQTVRFEVGSTATGTTAQVFVIRGERVSD